MKYAKYCCFFIFIILLTSCGGIQSYVDYDEDLNYENFSSYNFYQDMETGVDDLEEKRIKSALKENLASDSIFLKNKNPDFKINFYAEIFQKDHRHNIGISIGTIGRNVSGNIGSGIPIHTTENILSITVEFAHPENNELFWQGISERKLNLKASPEERKKQLDKMIKKLFKDFPPKGN